MDFRFHNAWDGLPVDVLRAWFLRGQRVANPENFQETLSKIRTRLTLWEANLASLPRVSDFRVHF